MNLTELNTAITLYKSAPPQAGPAIDWKTLLQLLPALLSIFIPNPALAAVITQLVQLVLNLFFPTAAATFQAARGAQAQTSAALATAIAAGSNP